VVGLSVRLPALCRRGLQVHPKFAFVGLEGLNLDNNYSMLHRNYTSVCKDFGNMHVSRSRARTMLC